MSRVFEALRRAEQIRRNVEVGTRARGPQFAPELWEPLGPERPNAAPEPQPMGAPPGRAQVVTLASLKGGVGKTVIAANLAYHLRELQKEVPTLLLACDEDPLADRMFSRSLDDPRAFKPSEAVVRGGRYGVFTLRPARRAWELGAEPGFEVAELLGETDWDGLVVVDTAPDFGPRTRGALAASDVILVPVSDRASLDKVAQLFELMDEWGLPRERVHLLLSQLDLRIKYREGESRDVLALLVAEIRKRGWPLLGAFLSRTPKVASLYTNARTRPRPVAEAAPSSVVHQQFRHLANDVLGLLAEAWLLRPVAASLAAGADGSRAEEGAPAELQLC